jgi:NADH-quinone oxidoreductase subunit L
MKAFLVNRVGDFGFILGIGLLLASTGSMNYDVIFAQNTALAAQTLPGTSWSLVTVCLYLSFYWCHG